MRGTEEEDSFCFGEVEGFVGPGCGGPGIGISCVALGMLEKRSHMKQKEVCSRCYNYSCAWDRQFGTGDCRRNLGEPGIEFSG